MIEPEQPLKFDAGLTIDQLEASGFKCGLNPDGTLTVSPPAGMRLDDEAVGLLNGHWQELADELRKRQQFYEPDGEKIIVVKETPGGANACFYFL